jgi:tetratricopeptide (TPR) repeat protein/KaiC/GvpD/RAD55 family RecA-like ATPase
MSLDNTSEMIRQILEQNNVPQEFCNMVYEKTRGNPFFAEEVIKSLKEEEVIYREGNNWKIKEVTGIEFPDTVRSLIKARIGRLGDEHQNVLTMASLVGNDFTLEALRGVTGLEEDKLRKIVDELLKTGLLKHRVAHGEDVCSFADIIVRDVVYEEVGTFERKKLHAAVGAALEKTYAQKIDEHVGELAAQFLEGGEKEKALDYFLKAGEKAAAVYANTEAASYYQSALSLLEEKEGKLSERARVLERLGDIKRLVGESNEAMKYWNNTVPLREQLDEKEGEARLYRKIASATQELAEWEKSKEYLSKALSILETMPENTERVLVYILWGWASWSIGNMVEARSWAEKACSLAERLKDFEGMANSYYMLGTVCGQTGEKEKSIEYLDKALEIATDKGYTDTALRTHINIGHLLPAEEYERRFEIWEKGFELAKKAGAAFSQSWFAGDLGSMYLDMGDMNKARALAEESVALDRKSGSFHLPFSLGFIGYVHIVLGDLGEAEQYVQEAFEISQRHKHFQSIAGSNSLLGRLAFEKGEYTKAKGFYEKPCEIWEKARMQTAATWSSLRVVWAQIELGELVEAEKLLDSVQKFAFEERKKVLAAYADAVRATLFRAQKKWEDSLVLFEKTIQEFDALNAERWNVYDFAKWVLCEYARTYLERDQPGDREKAHDLFIQALETFQKMGAKRDIEKVEARIAFIETGKVAPKPKPVEPVSTGYVDIDKLLYGGLPSSCAVVLTSPSCNERDLLVKSFLETGAKKGEVAFYITINPGSAKTLAEEFTSTFWLFVCNPQADAIIKDAPNVVKLKGVENLTDINIALTSAIRKLDPSLRGPRRICLSLVSDVLLHHHAVQTRRWLAGLIPELQSQGFTTLAVMDPEMHPPQEVRAILDLFEGEINIFTKETDKGPGKYLKIQKMSNQTYLEDELPLKKEQP